MSTKEERRAIRREKREMRKTLRGARKTRYNAIVEAAEKAQITIDIDDAEPKFVDAFNQVWPILKPVLEYAEIVKITGPGADKAIRAVIDLGERVSTGNASETEQTEFIRKLDNIWQPLKTVLGIIVTFTNDKVDKVINDIIEIGDWITEDKNI
jgi:hypothetical protein